MRAFKLEFWLEWELLLRGLNHFGCVGPSADPAVVLYVMLKTPYLVNMCFLWWQEAGKSTLSCSIYILLCCSTVGIKGPAKQCFSPNYEFWETSCANCFFFYKPKWMVCKWSKLQRLCVIPRQMFLFLNVPCKCFCMLTFKELQAVIFVWNTAVITF